MLYTLWFDSIEVPKGVVVVVVVVATSFGTLCEANNNDWIIRVSPINIVRNDIIDTKAHTQTIKINPKHIYTKKYSVL